MNFLNYVINILRCFIVGKIELSNTLGAGVGIADAIEMWSYIGNAGSQITVNLVTANSEPVLSASNSNSSKIR